MARIDGRPTYSTYLAAKAIKYAEGPIYEHLATTVQNQVLIGYIRNNIWRLPHANEVL